MFRTIFFRLFFTRLGLRTQSVFSQVYNPGDGINDVSLESFMAFSDRGFDPKIDGVVRESFHSFMHENALNPTIFPALKQFEIEVVSMGAHMLHGDAYTSGSLTSGGTESILMAVKTHRDRARHLWPHITHPEIVMPITGHPAFEKAAHYLSLTIVHVPLAPDFGVDVEAFERAITPNTILLVGSAPQYCHGVIDPIERLSEIAISRNLPLHVDACFGGFMLPWIEKLGYSIPKWDFRVPGVTSISADIHKYGYGLKGSSLILYRHANIRKFQFFAYSEWPGGLFVSPSMTGSRPGGNIASSWAVMRAMGESGYIDLAKQLMNVTEKIKAAVKSHPDLAILGNPHMTALSIVSRNPDVDILAVSDVVEKEGGWRVERQQKPSSLHFSVIPGLIPVVDKFVEDLLKAVEKVKADKTLAKKGTAAMYGMIGAIPDTEILSDFLVEFFSQVYTAPSS
eukprot:TRINITY_DN2263_c0_g1_i2.p1 TRINITY_DN2263_c0_g1~~TRINITY_DN2263_c0_g1_i2.p1  ORF type:complete len:454 (-),score=115.89 TRINITY_DN2263_c0_g1_i2:29-1390(-)